MRMRIPTVYQLALSVIILTVLLTGGVLSPRVATAATYYVARTGSNSNPGTESEPFGTIDRGVSVLRAGDTLYIRAGTYTNQIIVSTFPSPIQSGTSWSNAVTIAGYPGETVAISGISIHDGYGISYVIFDNLHILEQGLHIVSCDTHHVRFMNGEITISPNSPAGTSVVFGCGSYIEVLNSKIHGAPQGGYGFYWLGHDSIFDGNEAYDNSGYAYHIFNSGANDVSNNIISNNIIHGNGFCNCTGDGGIILASGSNNQAYNNIVYGNNRGIDVDHTHGGTNNRVSNNIIHDNIQSSINIGGGALNTIVENNILYQNGRPIDDYGVGTILINNLTTAP